MFDKLMQYGPLIPLIPGNARRLYNANLDCVRLKM